MRITKHWQTLASSLEGGYPDSSDLTTDGASKSYKVKALKALA